MAMLGLALSSVALAGAQQEPEVTSHENAITFRSKVNLETPPVAVSGRIVAPVSAQPVLPERYLAYLFDDIRLMFGNSRRSETYRNEPRAGRVG